MIFFDLAKGEIFLLKKRASIVFWKVFCIPFVCSLVLSDEPVFLGHYWSSGEPKPLTANITCVDYSAGKSGPFPLVAYRWEGEQILTNAGFRSAR